MGGVEDHIHILTSIHSTVCLANLVRDLKTSSNWWINKENVFPRFSGWQNEYAAFTKSHTHCEGIVNYINNQCEHHKKESFLDEYKRLLGEEGVVFEDRYLR